MFSRSSSLRVCVSVLLIFAATSAQNPTEKAVKDTVAVMTTELVKTGLYLISGGGGNSLLRFSANGLILVDGKLPGNYRPLMSQVRKTNKISDLPVRFLILTDHHPDHAGNNEQFQSAGVRIIAHDNVGHNLSASTSSGATAVPPAITFTHDRTLHLGGIEAQLMHFGNAHTDGDAVVYFPNLKVIAVGDLFSGIPLPDYSAGGSLVGWGPSLAQVLKLDFDTVVPSTGRIVSRADLEAFKTKVETLVVRATELVKKGVPKQQLMAQLKTDDLGWHFNFSPEQVDRFYQELSQNK